MTAQPYGTWASPISPDDLATGGVTLDLVEVAGDAIWWLEGRPGDQGRVTLVRRDLDERGRLSGPATDVTPPGFNVRTLVHEYGGGDYTVVGRTVYAVSFDDQRIHRIDADGGIRPITPEPERPRSVRYADLRASADGTRLYAVRETHPAGGGPADVSNDVVVLPTDGSAEPVRVLGGTDFVAAPVPAPDGSSLVAVTWNHPDMPWDSTRLVRVALDADGRAAGEPTLVGGGDGVSVMAPFHDHAGLLHAIGDPGGWWNVLRYGSSGGEPENLTGREVEVGGPAWRFGVSPCAPLADGRLVMVVSEGGVHHLEVRAPDGAVRTLDLPFTAVRSGSIRVHTAADGTERIIAIAAGPTLQSAVVSVDLADGGWEVVARSSTLDLDPAVVPEPRHITFPSADGREAHAVHHPPRNGDLTGVEGEAPPLVVMSHGGPTAQVFPVLSPDIAFWTSRGFAVVDVNYGGSTGYGRAYRELLRGRWGEVDVEDCVAAAAHLASTGDADPARTVIRGGSAGGYTTLRALTTVDAFAAGASYFGVADLTALARDTHKFESRYLDSVVGAWPEEEQRYVDRSPLSHLDGLSCPVLVLQGLEDEVVPPSQAEMIVQALAEKGIPHAYLAFEGEQHGFRKAETIIAAAEAELAFYGQVLGFTPAGDLPVLELWTNGRGVVPDR